MTVLHHHAGEALTLTQHVGVVEGATTAAGEEVEANGVALLNLTGLDGSKEGNLSALTKDGVGGGVAGVAELIIDLLGVAAAVDFESLSGNLVPVCPEVTSLALLDLESEEGALTLAVLTIVVDNRAAEVSRLAVVDGGLDPVGDVYGKGASDVLALTDMKLDGELRGRVAHHVGGVGLEGDRCTKGETTGLLLRKTKLL